LLKSRIDKLLEILYLLDSYEKENQNPEHIEQNLTQETDTEKQLLELVEQTIDELADEKIPLFSRYD